MDGKTSWNSTLELREYAYQLLEFTDEWHQNQKYCDYRPLFIPQDEWTVVKYVMEVLRLFRYWTLRMSKRHTVTLHHVITVYNDMFDYMDGVMQASAGKKTLWKKDLFFAVKLARQKLSKYYAVVTPTTGTHLISAHILDPFHKLRSFIMWDKRMVMTHEDEPSYTTRYQEAFLKYVQNEYCAKHQRVLIKNSKAYRSAITSALQQHQDPVNHPLIHMICEAMMKNT